MAEKIHVKNKSQPRLSAASSSGKSRVNAFQAKKPGFFRRIFRVIFHPVALIGYLLIASAIVFTLGYYWFEFSEKVDRLLAGEVFTSSAGIYASPKILKQGEGITKEELVTYLKSAGYIQKNQQASKTRSRYALEDQTVEIEPGETATVDGKTIFQPLRIKFAKDGKSISSISDLSSNQNVPQTLLEPRLLSSIVAEGDGRRKAVSYQDVPESLQKAIIVTEDRDFFNHYGVNLRGIARALWRRVDSENDKSPLARQGGSSITQQLVKNLLLSSDYSIERKVKEAYMSLILETRLSKEEIFTLYVNQIYLGQQSGIGVYGVGQAANSYFGKDVSQLSLAESAFLAGIIRSPNRYNPYKNLEKVTERRNQVLDSMFETGNISAAQKDEARKSDIKLAQVAQNSELLGLPYFSQYAESELPKIISDPDALQHLRVYTTIDVDLQKLAYEAVRKRLEKIERLFPNKKANLNAALVAIRPKTGEIVAMIGGKDYETNQFNRATEAQRQPGSVFKPFVYAAAINTVYEPSGRVLTPATIFKDEAKTFTFNQETYKPNNFGDFFSNKDVTLRDALVKSKNVITVDLAMELNIGKVMNFAAKAGLPKVAKAYPSMALGTAEVTPLQMATAYTTFANLGEKTSPIGINRITNGEGKTISAPVTEKKTVMRPDVAYIMDDMLKDVINRGTAADAKAWGISNGKGRGFAGKTGTSRDGWFAGFTPNLVCVVYVGFDDGSDLGMKGGDSALPIWADFMQDALSLHPEWNGDWQMPDGIRKGEIDIRNGKLIRELTGSEAEMIELQKEVRAANSNSNANTNTNPERPDSPLVENIYVTDVPPEFRRIELFIAGTVPNKALAVEPTPTPLDDESWRDTITAPSPEESPQPNPTGELNQTPKPTPEIPKNVTIMICPISNKRATAFCPNSRATRFENGTEPDDYCQFHAKPKLK
jgi:penicillin-binding protein 1B